MADSVLLAGAGARINFSIGTANFAFGPATMIGVFKRPTISTWDTLIGDWASGKNRLGVSDGNLAFMTVAAADDLAGPSVTVVDWFILGVTKATGTVVPRYHFYNGTSWTHEADGTGIANSSVMGAFEVSESGGDAFAGNVLIFGVDNVVMSDVEIEALQGGYLAWINAGFAEGVRCNAISGLTSFTGGTMAQTSITGASVDTGDVPSWWNDALSVAAVAPRENVSHGLGPF